MKNTSCLSSKNLPGSVEKILIFSAIIAAAIFFSISAEASALRTAGEFNTFIFGDFSCTSDTEGRLAVGGKAFLDHYSVADKLTAAEQSTYQDMLVVGSDLTVTGGRVYYGNIVTGGSASLGHENVADGSVFENVAPLPVNFTAEGTYLKALSKELAELPATGTAKEKWSGLEIKGDNRSALQIFYVDGNQLPNLTYIVGQKLNKVPSGATIVFNVSGTTSGLTGGWQPLKPYREKVLFNFYEATKLNIKNLSVEGSILAPFAHVDDPQGVINGTIIAASWNGPMQQNHVPFIGEGLPEPEVEPEPEPEPEEPTTVPPSVPGEVTCWTAEIDGDYSEWNLEDDLYAAMYEAGDSTKTHLSNVYLRYDSSSKTLYALVLRVNDWAPDLSANNAWLKIYDLGSSTLVDGTSPDFKWIYDNGMLIGYEASVVLPQGSYNEFEAHMSVDNGRTSSTGKKKQEYMPLSISCPEPPAEPEANVAKYQRLDDSADWIVDPLYGLDVGDTLSYQISVENFSYADDLGLTILDTLSELVDFDAGLYDTVTLEKIDANGSLQSVDASDYSFSYDSVTRGLSLDYSSTLLSNENLLFSFDVIVNDSFSPGMTIANTADVTFNGYDPLETNTVEAFSAATVPEPSTIFLFGVGLLGVLGLGRKLKKR